MDQIESLSDCSESSRASELIPSDTSTISGLSAYQGEFFELKQLIDPSVALKHLKASPDSKNNTVIAYYETRIQNLNTQLQNALKGNEKYKHEVYNLEKKADLSQNFKIEKLLRRNNQLEANLEAANNQIQRLISVYSSKDSDDVAVLQDKILSLEKYNHDLNLENSLLSNQINQCNYHKNEIESQFKGLKDKINDLKLELAVKINCVSELKAKISEQHVRLQSVLQNNAKLTHSVDSLTNELQYVVKSENWYKNELHQLQKEKINLTEEISEKKTILIQQDEKLEQLKLELNKWKCAFEEMRLKSLRDKENVLKQLEIVNSKESVDTSSYNYCDNNIEAITNYYEVIIRDLTNDVAKIRSNFENQQNSIEQMTKENSGLLAKYLSLQNFLKERESVIEKLENSQKVLKMKLAAALDKEQEFNSNFLELKKINSSLEIELCVKKQEKEHVEESVKAIKDQFSVFKNKYNSLKEELHSKNKEILQLQFDKQELYMNNNWKICELEKLKLKDVEIGKLQEKLTFSSRSEDDLRSRNSSQLKEIADLRRNCIEVEAKYSEMNEKYEKVLLENRCTLDLLKDKEMMIIKLEEGVEMLKKQIADNTNNTQHVMHQGLTNFVVNNFALDNEHVVEILQHVCKLCKIVDCVDLSTQSNQALLVGIDNYFQLINNEIRGKDEMIGTQKKKISKLKNQIKQIERLEDRCKVLHDKSEQNASLLVSLLNRGKDCDWNEEIKHLQALLQVKIREQKDKQARYESNYRTLLRKVKEHMKGRNTAEKHNLHLQELYNALSDECNTLRLQTDLRENELKKLYNCMEDSTKNNEKLKAEVLNLEKRLSLSSQCKRCIELEIMQERERELERSLKNCESHKATALDELRLKEEQIDTLKKENQELLFKCSAVSNDYENSFNKIQTLVEENKQLVAKLYNHENALLQEKSLNENLKIELIEANRSLITISTEKEQLNRRNEKIEEQNMFLLKQVEHVNSCLQLKTEELKELLIRKEQLESNWSKRDTNTQNVVSALQTQLQLYKTEIDTIRSEKFFLQRLCNDLKIALTAHVNHNKVLKEYVNNLCKEKECSPTLSNFPSPTKYDDGYINRLLQENKAPLGEKPLSDIQECLDTLRQEIVVLQKQIIEKNGVDEDN